MEPEALEAMVRQHYRELDASTDLLSHMREGLVASLPSWVLSHRRITVGISAQHRICVYKVVPAPDLQEDAVAVSSVITDAELGEITAPYAIQSILQTTAEGLALEMGDMSFGSDDTYTMPKEFFCGIRGYCFLDAVDERFSLDNARRQAQNLWGNAVNGFPPGSSFLANAQQVFSKFRCLVRLKNYRERKVHRYINEHRGLLLPSFANCYFEHELRSGTEVQRADFILKRESLFPALLIELESPAARLLKKNGELTAEANHAREQIARWVRLIGQNPQNSEGEMDFLRGDKQRLIVMGRGSESELSDSRYTDTTVWTYDVFLVEAKRNWNRIMAEQCRLLKIDSPPSFPVVGEW